MVLTSCSRSDTEYFLGSSPSLPILPKIYQAEALSREQHFLCLESELYTADIQIPLHYLY